MGKQRRTSCFRLSRAYEAVERKNGLLKSEKVTMGLNRKVWWVCEKGHEWQATVRSRVEKVTGCPVCANRRSSPRENDLKTCMPHLAAQ